jgi:hypothetical protein
VKKVGFLLAFILSLADKVKNMSYEPTSFVDLEIDKAVHKFIMTKLLSWRRKYCLVWESKIVALEKRFIL